MISSSGLGCIHSAQKISDMSYNQLISDPWTYVKKRTHRSEDSILLRLMDDVVGTGPDEQLMSDFEHMKDSPVFYRCGGCCAMKVTQSTYLGLEITKTCRSFEVKKQYRPCGIPFESLRVGKLETDSQSR